jgi:anti-sigma B factor antagonist
MPLTLQSEWFHDVVVVRCQGRIVLGPEITALQKEVEKQTELTKKVVLQLADVSFIDSAGLGALVRQFGVLRSHRGDLKLCQLSPFLQQVLQVTNLHRIFSLYESEQDAIRAFSKGPQSLDETIGGSRTRIVCIDTSQDLLAYVSALLKRSGYEVFTTRQPSDASLLVRVTIPRILICGPGTQANESAMRGFRELSPGMELVLLPADFSTADAGHAGTDLVNRVQALLSN